MSSVARTVLHIDDDPGLARLLQRALGKVGFEVENAPDGATGLQRIRDGGIDAVVLDHYLGGETGLSILEQLAAVPDSPPVVYVTGSSETAIAVQALKAGAVDYVHKSVEEDFFALLSSAIEQAVENNRLKREKEKAEQEVRAARDRAELLLAEVNHRVANSLALAASLVRLQASAVKDPVARDALTETQARISAIASLHKKLYTSEDVRTVDLQAYITMLANEIDASMMSGSMRPRLRLDLAPFSMSTDRAVSVGMVLTELLTNAYKYAYPEGVNGEVRVKLEPRGDASALLSIEDDGIGWSGKGKPKGTGLGSRIVQAMATNLGTSIEYGDGHGGTRVEVLIRSSLN